MSEKGQTHLLEVIGSHFTDVFFNHVYEGAVKSAKNGDSVTDVYQRHIHAYVVGTKNDKRCYTDIVNGLHKYVAAQPRYTTMSFSKFIDYAVSIFVPSEYYTILSADDRDETFCDVICSLIANLGAYCTEVDMLKHVVDRHDEHFKITIQMLQTRAIGLLMNKKNEIRNMYLSEIGQTNQNSSMDVQEKLKSALKDTLRDKVYLAKQWQEEQLVSSNLRERLYAAEVQVSSLMRTIRELESAREKQNTYKPEPTSTTIKASSAPYMLNTAKPKLTRPSSRLHRASNTTNKMFGSAPDTSALRTPQERPKDQRTDGMENTDERDKDNMKLAEEGKVDEGKVDKDNEDEDEDEDNEDDEYDDDDDDHSTNDNSVDGTILW